MTLCSVISVLLVVDCCRYCPLNLVQSKRGNPQSSCQTYSFQCNAMIVIEEVIFIIQYYKFLFFQIPCKNCPLLFCALFLLVILWFYKWFSQYFLWLGEFHHLKCLVNIGVLNTSRLCYSVTYILYFWVYTSKYSILIWMRHYHTDCFCI
jgi:hypothetical protein